MSRALEVRRPRASLAIAAAFAVVALLVAGGGAPQAGAAPQPRLEIAETGSSVWTRASHADWAFDNLRPGAMTTNTIRLRTVDAPAAGALLLDLEVPDPGPLLRHVRVASMSLDGVDLLPRWSGCASGALTLQVLSTCATTPDLPLPAAGGSTFSMSLELPLETSNEAQGQSTGRLRFLFSLVEHGTSGGEGHGGGSGSDGAGGGGSPPGGTDADNDGSGAATGGGRTPSAPAPASSGHGLGSLTSVVQRVTVPFAALPAATAGALFLLALGRRRDTEHRR